VRRRWLNLCTVWPSQSQISSLSTAILSLEKTRSRREPNLGCRGDDRPGWWDSLICSFDHCECEGHRVDKFSQRRLTADWLPHGRMTVYGCAVRSPLTGCQVTSRPRDWFSRCSKWLDTFWTGLVRGVWWRTISAWIVGSHWCFTLSQIQTIRIKIVNWIHFG